MGKLQIDQMVIVKVYLFLVFTSKLYLQSTSPGALHRDFISKHVYAFMQFISMLISFLVCICSLDHFNIINV